MPIPALVVTCESTWLAPIRMPGALARAGFEVTLLSPPDALAARSRYVARSHMLPDNANAQAWLLALAAAVDAARPAIVFPGDEPSSPRVASRRSDCRGKRHRQLRRHVVVRSDGTCRDAALATRDLYRAFASALREADVADRLASIGAQVVANSPDEFEQDLRDDFRRWADVVRRANIHR